MKRLVIVYENISKKLSIAKDLPLLFMRLVLAYGFYDPAIKKWNNMSDIISWFDSMGMPFPTINAYMAATTEITGVVLLSLGLFTRIISVPLMLVMLVAINTVHFSNGFEAGNNGFEIPLYYLIMLFTLTIYGGGKISLDSIIKGATKKL